MESIRASNLIDVTHIDNDKIVTTSFVKDVPKITRYSVRMLGDTLNEMKIKMITDANYKPHITVL
jgi:hypothetical protein